MSISDNNFSLPNIPQNEEENTSQTSAASGELSGHAITQSGEENSQISETGEKAIQDLGNDSTEPHHLPSGITVSTSGGEGAQNIANSIIKFSTETGTLGNLSRSTSLDSLHGTQLQPSDDSMSLSDISADHTEPSSLESIGRSSSLPNLGSTTLNDDMPSLPKYDPKSNLSIQEFLRQPSVLANMKEKGGHFIYPDYSRSSFIFIPNGDFSKARSIKVTNGKTKADITNPAQLETCIAKYAVIHNEAESDWQGRGSAIIRQNLGLSPDTPINITHFTLNFKYKQAIAYGPFNTNESSPGYTPSAWRRGSKVKVNKGVWEDVGGLNSIDLSKRVPSDNSNINFSTETSESSPKTSATQTTAGPAQQPVVININVAGGQGGQGGPSHIVVGDQQGSQQQTETKETSQQATTTSTPAEEETSTESLESSNSIEEAPTTNDTIEGDDNEENNISSNQGHGTLDGTNNLEDLLGKIRKHLDAVYNGNGDYVGDGTVQIKDIIRDHENGTSSQSSDSFSESPLGSPVSISPVAAKVAYTPSNVSRQRISNDDDETNLEDILTAVRSHLDEVYSPEGTPEENGIGKVIQEVENSSTSPVSSKKTTTIPSLALPEEAPSNNELVEAAQTTSSALQNLLSSITPQSTEEAESTNQTSSKIPALDLPEETPSNNDLIAAAQTTSSALQDLLSSINFTSKQEESSSSSKIPALDLPEETPSNNELVEAAQTTSSALQNLLNSITPEENAPSSIPTPEAETGDLKSLLKKVRAHIESVYVPGGQAQIGGIGKVIKSEENKNS